MPDITWYTNTDGTLKIIPWAEAEALSDGLQRLIVSTAARPTQVAHSTATGQGLVSNGALGVDTIRLAAGEGFTTHTHPGDHLLIIIGGEGTILYDGVIYPTRAGEVYLVAGMVPHAVGAITDHVILAVGSPHKAVDDHTRMTPVAYQTALSHVATLDCRICGRSWSVDALTHPHCDYCPLAACLRSTHNHASGA